MFRNWWIFLVFTFELFWFDWKITWKINFLFYFFVLVTCTFWLQSEFVRFVSFVDLTQIEGFVNRNSHIICHPNLIEFFLWHFTRFHFSWNLLVRIKFHLRFLKFSWIEAQIIYSVQTTQIFSKFSLQLARIRFPSISVPTSKCTSSSKFPSPFLPPSFCDLKQHQFYLHHKIFPVSFTTFPTHFSMIYFYPTQLRVR